MAILNDGCPWFSCDVDVVVGGWEYYIYLCHHPQGIISSSPIFICLYSCHESILITSMELKVMQVIAISYLRTIKANKPLL